MIVGRLLRGAELAKVRGCGKTRTVLPDPCGCYSLKLASEASRSILSSVTPRLSLGLGGSLRKDLVSSLQKLSLGSAS